MIKMIILDLKKIYILVKNNIIKKNKKTKNNIIV